MVTYIQQAPPVRTRAVKLLLATTPTVQSTDSECQTTVSILSIPNIKIRPTPQRSFSQYFVCKDKLTDVKSSPLCNNSPSSRSCTKTKTYYQFALTQLMGLLLRFAFLLSILKT
ncbi:hypothetical protein BDZ94DRAFT_981144 [Collybia nuda]|uniref:Uncharacterized protein n=1 Tax=Collybia nuda TaxID=64659 RepID=A0A9P6CPI8_9AGAR|nr:hypothetical protein BDZ94DRAFT_637596 [Collybia nuda]KAF9467723.1 hypothetical protein BDZ94DRAFT_981144 [Collybia nuda]